MNSKSLLPEITDRPVLGIACSIAAYFSFAVMQVYGKLLSETYSVIEIAFYRNLIALIIFLVYIAVFWKRGRRILKINQNPVGIIIRSVIGLLCLVLSFAAFALMPMAEATAFLFVSSLLVPALGVIFLAEKVGALRWGAVIVGFIGVLIMLQPNGELTTFAIAIALTTAFLLAVQQVILRHLGKTEVPLTVTFYFVFIGTIVSALPMPFVATTPSLQSLPLLLGVGVSGLLAQLFLSLAHRYAEAAVVSVFNYSGIIWATLFGWFVWNDWPTIPIWIGGVIVILSNIFILWREQQLASRA